MDGTTTTITAAIRKTAMSAKTLKSEGRPNCGTVMNRQSYVSRRGLGANWNHRHGTALANWLEPAISRSICCGIAAGRSELVRRIADTEIRAGVESAIVKNLAPAATERSYPGHFTITADGGADRSDTTWPGLDSWQMTGAFLLLGDTRLVLDYFEYVRASQRKDGNIPFAIFTGETRPGGFLRGLKHPDDVFMYKPPNRPNLPASSQETRKWIGLFEHWGKKTRKPILSAHWGQSATIPTAAEIFATTSLAWLSERLPSLQAAGKYLLGRQRRDGLIGGSGFYTELPPRYECDGVTQCYVIHAFRTLARLFGDRGDKISQVAWTANAERLMKNFVAVFWRDDHFWASTFIQNMDW